MATRKSVRKSSRRSLRNPRLSLEQLEARRCLAVFNVPAQMALAAAISTADSNADSNNTINLAAGTYPLTDQVIQASSPSKSLLIAGAGSGSTIITANQSGRVLDIVDSNVGLQNLTITGGKATDDGNGGNTAEGGGLLINGGEVAVSNVNMSGNQAAGANGNAGANGQPGTPGADACGGGVYLAQGTLILKNSTLSNNSAIGGNGGVGGMGGLGAGGGIGGAGANGVAGAAGAAGAPAQPNWTGYGGVPGGNGGVGRIGGNGRAGQNGAAGGIGAPGADGGNGGDADGGGIYVAQGQVILKLTSLSGNAAQGGAGAPGGIGGQGGDGGTGGPGGHGGTGGPGGTGGNGATIRHGSWGYPPTLIAAGNGGNGGAGGNGGVGGQGGHGGVGSNGGNGGSGGSGYGGGIYLGGGTVLLTAGSSISTSTASAGNVGAGAPGGNGGNAGTAGAGGKAGLGGAGGSGGSSYFPSAPGTAGSAGKAGAMGAAGALGSAGSPGSDGASGVAAGDSIYPTDTPTGPSGSEATPPSVTLTAPNVNAANAASETPYTFQLVFTDDNLVDASSLPSSTAEVVPPTGSPIAATMVGSPTTSGSTDALGDAQQITVTYQISPPAGTWSASPAGAYTVQLGGSPVTDLANNSAPTGPIGTFSNLTSSTAGTLTVTPADWTSAGLTLTLGSDGNLHVYTTGTTTDAVAPVGLASVTNIVITSPSSTTANLTIDSTAGNPVPTGGLTYGGGGGLIKTGSGHVTLSGANTYTGGTAVSDGTLLITATNVLADGGSLTVGAGGTFVFDPSQSASSSLAAGLAAPAPGRTTPSGLSTPIVAPSALDNVPGNASARSTLSPFLESQVKNLSHVPRTAPTLSATPGSTLQTPAINKSRATIFAVFASHRSALNRTVSSADIARSASSWAWLAAIESFWNSSGQNRMTGSTVEALDKVLAQFGL